MSSVWTAACGQDRGTHVTGLREGGPTGPQSLAYQIDITKASPGQCAIDHHPSARYVKPRTCRRDDIAGAAIPLVARDPIICIATRRNAPRGVTC